MAGVDASIPLQFQFPKLPTAQDVEALKQLQYRNQLSQLQVQDAQQQVQQQNALLDVFKQPGAMGPDGLPTSDTLGRVTAVNPEAGLKLTNSLADIRRAQQEAQTNFINSRLLNLKINGDQHDKLVDIATQSQVRYDDLIKQGANPTEAAKTVSDERNNALDDAVKDGTILPDQARNLRIPFDPGLNRSFIAGSKQYKTVLDEQARAQQEQTAQQREERIAGAQEREATAAEQRAQAASETPFMKEAAARYGKDSPEYQQALAAHLGKEQGGGAGNYGGREAVFTNRALSAASLGTRDLSNIARGPVSQGTGWFGGRSQGPGLLDATKEQLANTLTPQDIQTYNVKIAGLTRNLATLESQGLAPGGSLTHQMDSVVFKQGDTQLTKAYKLAETRQIIEGGMQPILSDPRVPDATKDLARKLIDSAKQSVPYTVEDLDDFSNSTKPGARLTDFIKKQPSGGSQGKAPQAALDYLKAHPEAKDQFKAKYGYLP